MRTWFYGPGSWITRVSMWFLGPLRAHGLEHVPREGAFILVSNHISLLDPMIIGSTAGQMAGRLVHFMAKEELRHWPLIGWLADYVGLTLALGVLVLLCAGIAFGTPVISRVRAR